MSETNLQGSYFGLEFNSGKLGSIIFRTAYDLKRWLMQMEVNSYVCILIFLQIIGSFSAQDGSHRQSWASATLSQTFADLQVLGLAIQVSECFKV